MTAALPYREEQPPRTYCQQQVALPIPEIESDGSEVSHRRCENQAVDTCESCDRPVCDEHKPAEDKGCQACEDLLARQLAPLEQSMLTPAQRRKGVAKVVGIMAGAYGIFTLLIWMMSARGPLSWVGVAVLLGGSAFAQLAARDLRTDKVARIQPAKARDRLLGPRRKGLAGRGGAAS